MTEYLKLPIELLDKCDDDKLQKDPLKATLRIKPEFIIAYHEATDKGDELTKSVIMLSNGQTFWIDLTVKELEEKLNKARIRTFHN